MIANGGWATRANTLNALRCAEGLIGRDCWEIAHPDDPEMRRYLIEDEEYSPPFADAVLGYMRELDAQRPPGWSQGNFVDILRAEKGWD